MKPYAPLATLTTAAVLRREGVEVVLFDAMLAAGVEEFHRALETHRPAIVGIVEDSFNFLTKMCTVRMREAALGMIRAAKARGCRVAVNGYDATDRAELYLEAGADAVILGEPESVVPDLVQLWARDRNAPLAGVTGLVLQRAASNGGNGRVETFHTAARATIRDLDSLPFPAWDLIDTERYRVAWTEAHGRLSWNVVTSRGCPYRCNWCAKPLFGSRYAQRSPVNVAEELRLLRDQVRPDHVWFADDIFGLTERWIEQFAREVRARGAQIPFTMQSRVNLMKPTVVEHLAAAGAEEVWLGVESGSQRILDAMDKGTKIDQVRAATQTLRQHGIRVCWFIQLGYLGETWPEILLTRNLIREERPDDIGVSVSYPLPGTKFFETVRDQLGRKTNWIDSDELAMIFSGTYRTPFYRMVRDLLHEEVLTYRDGATTTPQGRLDDRWLHLEGRERAWRSPDATARAAR